MKKRLITVICLILAFLSFASCSQTEPEPTGLAALSKEELYDYFDDEGYSVGYLAAEFYSAAGVTEDECEYVLTVSPKNGDGHDFIYAFKTDKQAQAFFSKIPEGEAKLSGKMVVRDMGLGEAAEFFD